MAVIAEDEEHRIALPCPDGGFALGSAGGLFDLIRNREVLRAILADVAHDAVDSSNAAASGLP